VALPPAPTGAARSGAGSNDTLVSWRLSGLRRTLSEVGSDPTTLNRLGNDRDESYRPAIFYTNEEQKRVALDTIADVDASGLRNRPMTDYRHLIVDHSLVDSGSPL
jgi:hypothetical protein